MIDEGDTVPDIGKVAAGNQRDPCREVSWYLGQHIRDAADKIPVMLINAGMSYPNIYSVARDDRKAIYEAKQCLYRTGTENVLFACNQKSYSGIRKLAGFHEAARTYDKDWDGYSIYCPNKITNVHVIAYSIDLIIRI